MALLDDPSREREADPPAALLGGKARLEDPRTKVARDAGAVVRHGDDGAAVRTRARGDDDASAAAGERVDGVLHEDLERPLEEHGVAAHGYGLRVRRDVDLDGVGECGDPGAKVARDAIDEGVQVDRFGAPLAADALEAMRD